VIAVKTPAITAGRRPAAVADSPWPSMTMSAAMIIAPAAMAFVTR
jgi:hypothetical protein